jgi:hypothetical protein
MRGILAWFLGDKTGSTMGDIVNLRGARKQKARREAEKSAEANRIAFGRTKSERERTGMENAIAERRIDGHRRDDVMQDPTDE